MGRQRGDVHCAAIAPHATGDDIYMRVQYKAIWSVSPDGAADHRQVVEPVGRNPCTMNSRYLNPDGATDHRQVVEPAGRNPCTMNSRYLSPDGATER